MTPEERRVQLESFDQVWRTIRDKHWDTKLVTGPEWQKVYQELRPRAEKAETATAIRQLMQEMLDRLKQSHCKIISADLMSAVDTEAVMGWGQPEIEARVLDGEVLVTHVGAVKATPVTPKLGWRVVRVNGKDLAPALRAVEKAYPEGGGRDLRLTRLAEGRLMGPVGTNLEVVFADEQGVARTVMVLLQAPKGKLSSLGNMPPSPVFFEAKRLPGEIGYIRFNYFLDPVRISTQFGEAVKSCSGCRGLVVDVRGNPGGIGLMASGLAGWFIDSDNRELGKMYMRDNTLQFTVNPRPEPYAGPVAVLIDGASASTAEIFAGGLQDLGRARVFGTRSAAAALPSIVERLPNGDAFQYAVANYISASGRALEGRGVVPDEEVRLTRATLLQQRDAVVDAAVAWIRKQGFEKRGANE